MSWTVDNNHSQKLKLNRRKNWINLILIVTYRFNGIIWCSFYFIFTGELSIESLKLVKLVFVVSGILS